MIKLKSAMNYKGDIVPVGTILSLGEREASLVEKGVAEYVTKEVTAKNTESIKPDGQDKKEPEKEPEKEPVEKPLNRYTKPEMLEYAAKMKIPDVSEQMSRNEILAAIGEFRKGKE